jgi:curved DNA-binding protein CbpA
VTPPENRDLYAVLGVAPDASPDQIGRAYRRLLRAHHPDIDPDCDSAAVTAAVAAATILRDPARRAAYDRSRRPNRDQHTAATPPSPARRHHTVADIRAGPVRWHPH